MMVDVFKHGVYGHQLPSIPEYTLSIFSVKILFYFHLDPERFEFKEIVKENVSIRIRLNKGIANFVAPYIIYGL